MKSLEQPDSLHLHAAQGWCELHAFAEAEAELDKIDASLGAHPKVLEVRWQLYANLEKWVVALDIANLIVKTEPEWPSGWIYRASSLTELDRQQEAYETLSAAAVLFPSDKIVLYDCACVCCALQRLEEALEWLAKAVEAGGNETKRRALGDPDLESLWK